MAGFSRFDKFLVILGLLALFCLSPVGREVAAISLMIIIGIPLTIIMFVIPPLFLFLVLARLSHLVLKRIGLGFWPVSAVVSAGLLAIIPYFENQRLDRLALELVADDRNEIVQPVKVEALAVIFPTGYNRKGVCDEFCQRALIKGVVNKVIMARMSVPMGKPEDTLTAKSFRLEKRDKCPEFNLKDGGNNYKFAGVKRVWGDKTPADIIRLNAARGLCFIEEETTIAEANAVLVRGTTVKGMSKSKPGFQPIVDAISASSILYYIRENGHLVERYRETAVTINPLLTFLAPTYLGMGTRFSAGLSRTTKYVGAAKRFRPAPPFGNFVQDILGFDLTLDNNVAQNETRQIIAEALEKPGEINPAVALVVEVFFKELHRRKDASKDDAPLALQILEDLRLPVPRYAAAPIRKFAKNDAALADRFAAALFARLFITNPTERENIPSYVGYRIKYLAAAIAVLPDEAVLPYRAELERLATDPERRVMAYQSLIKLSVFGEDAVPVLIYLIDDAAKNSTKKTRRGDAWQHPYLAGLQGLCKMGPKGQAAIPMLKERLGSGVLVKYGSYWGLTINTLISLGANPDELWPYLESDNKNRTRERFDREAGSAAKKIDCSY